MLYFDSTINFLLNLKLYIASFIDFCGEIFFIAMIFTFFKTTLGEAGPKLGIVINYIMLFAHIMQCLLPKHDQNSLPKYTVKLLFNFYEFFKNLFKKFHLTIFGYFSCLKKSILLYSMIQLKWEFIFSNMFDINWGILHDTNF